MRLDNLYSASKEQLNARMRAIAGRATVLSEIGAADEIWAITEEMIRRLNTDKPASSVFWQEARLKKAIEAARRMGLPGQYASERRGSYSLFLTRNLSGVFRLIRPPKEYISELNRRANIIAPKHRPGISRNVQEMHAITFELLDYINQRRAAATSAWSEDRLSEAVMEADRRRLIFRFDPNQGALFSTYLQRQLRDVFGCVTENWWYAGESIRNLLRQIGNCEEEFERRHGRAPEEIEIAEHFSIPLLEYQALHSFFRHAPLGGAGDDLSLEALIGKASGLANLDRLTDSQTAVATEADVHESLEVRQHKEVRTSSPLEALSADESMSIDDVARSLLMRALEEWRVASVVEIERCFPNNQELVSLFECRYSRFLRGEQPLTVDEFIATWERDAKHSKERRLDILVLEWQLLRALCDAGLASLTSDRPRYT